MLTPQRMVCQSSWMTPKVFGQRLKKRRVQLKMSRWRLAKEADLYDGSAKCFETGERYPSVPNLLALAQALGVKPGYFLD